MTGFVEDIDLQVTTVRTFDNEQITVPKITVPSLNLTTTAVTNPVAYDTLRQTVVFDDDIDHAKATILDEADVFEPILADPAPDIHVTELGDSAVGLQTRFWIADPSRADFVRIQSDLVQAVKERFDADGIDMPYPYQTLTGTVDIKGDLES